MRRFNMLVILGNGSFFETNNDEGIIAAILKLGVQNYGSFIFFKTIDF